MERSRAPATLVELAGIVWSATAILVAAPQPRAGSNPARSPVRSLRLKFYVVPTCQLRLVAENEWPNGLSRRLRRSVIFASEVLVDRSSCSMDAPAVAPFGAGQADPNRCNGNPGLVGAFRGHHVSAGQIALASLELSRVA